MDRAEAIKILQTEIACVKREDCARIECAKCDLVLETSDVLTAYGMAIAALREQDATDINDGRKWISVKERLPEKSGLVIGYDTTWGVACFYYHADMISSAWQSITHWMPLPEPPKEGAEG